MNKILKLKSILTLFIITAITFSCSSDDNTDIQGPSTETTYELIVNTTNAGNIVERDLKITTAELNSKVKVNVTFTSEQSMRRLYIAKSENGGTYEPFAFTNQQVDKKKDGSVDLVGDDKKTFTFNIDFDTPKTVDGTITYILWATTGRGDFRDVSKRNAIGEFDFGTITITAGNGAVGDGLKSYTQTILNAPLGDGSSGTFMSVFDGEIYKINEGEELAALWDFGYYYGDTNKASLASTSNYPSLFNHDNDINTPLVAVSTLTGVAQEELNNFYIAKTTEIDFDAITKRADLDAIVKPDTEVVTKLIVGDILIFVDDYGNKGMIKITEIVPGIGTSGKITFDIKVQTSQIFKP